MSEAAEESPFPSLDWQQAAAIGPRAYTCGHCGREVGPDRGYYAKGSGGSASPAHRIYICSRCTQPTYFDGQRQFPGHAFGNEVQSLPADVEALYREARQSFGVAAYTAAVLTCRKILMNLAVGKGAPEGKNFLFYVESLAKAGYVPPDGQGWVDHIRRKGNEANHEIQLMTQADAEELISFVEMLLEFAYEFPARVPPAP